MKRYEKRTCPTQEYRYMRYSYYLSYLLWYSIIPYLIGSVPSPSNRSRTRTIFWICKGSSGKKAGECEKSASTCSGSHMTTPLLTMDYSFYVVTHILSHTLMAQSLRRFRCTGLGRFLSCPTVYGEGIM